MMTDPISDMLSRIRNGAAVHKAIVEVPHSKMKFALAKVIEKEGYLNAVEQTEGLKGRLLRLHLKYENGQSVIHAIQRVSTPGHRVYSPAKDLGRVRFGHGISIVSTSNGLMTNKEAKKRRLGGELICEIF